MSNNFPVYNVKTKQRLRYKQAIRLEADGQIVWVEEGKTWRTATREDLPAIIAKRNEQARLRSPLEFAELPGIVVRDIKTDYNLIHQAHQFAETQC
jgi:hypothetical protein